MTTGRPAPVRANTGGKAIIQVIFEVRTRITRIGDGLGLAHEKQMVRRIGEGHRAPSSGRSRSSSNRRLSNSGVDLRQEALHLEAGFARYRGRATFAHRADEVFDERLMEVRMRRVRLLARSGRG